MCRDLTLPPLPPLSHRAPRVFCTAPGHVHSYYRMLPVYDNKVESSYENPTYPVHMIVGGAGCDEVGAGDGTVLVVW